MKKVLVSILVLLMVCLFGCTSNGEALDEPSLIRVGFSQTGSESDWRIAQTASIVDSLSEANGYELLLDNAKQKQENQYLAIRNFIQQEVDYIILAPITEYGWEKVLNEAKEAGIPVILVDRQINVKDDSLYVSWIGSDIYEEGKTATDWLQELLYKKHRLHEDIRILHLQGTDYSTTQILRTKALNDAVSRNPNWCILADLKGEYIEAKSYELVRDYLKRETDIDVIYSENDNMTFGAIKALDEAGLSYGIDGDVVIISFDATREALNYCLDGKINLCIECNPLHGPKVASLIQQLEQGRTPARRNYVDETLFTFGNLIPEIVNAREY